MIAAFAACGDDVRNDAEGSGAPYALCDGSDDVRLAVISDGGGPLESTFNFTNPYGHRFLYVTGKCEYLTGKSLTLGAYRGTLSEDQAKRIETDLHLTSLPSWSGHQDQSCPDAGVFYVRSATGYGACSCGCDDKAPSGLEEALNAAGELQEALTQAGTALDGPVEMIALSTDDTSRAFQLWPIAYDLEAIAVPEAQISETMPTAHILSDADAASARALRKTARETDRDGDDVRVKTDETHLYKLYIRDQVPSSFAQSIVAFGAPPQP